jgi:uncharacterized membrane protein YbhN (UPF0104 family)
VRAGGASRTKLLLSLLLAVAIFAFLFRLVSHLSLYLVLLVTLPHVGIDDAEVPFVFAFGRLATAIRFTPGGAGVVEAVRIGGLVAFGADPAQATASVLVFRASTWLLPVPLGLVTCLGWRWRQHRRVAPVA